MVFSATEQEQYARHFALAGLGVEGQQQLKAARAVCVGLGGLGCPALQYLVAAGVGTVGLVDPDRVEISNLQRQPLYSHDDLGLKKVDVAKRKLARLNPYTDLHAHDLTLDHSRALALLSQYDIVLDCSDNFATRYLVNDACFHLRKPWVFASVSEYAGMCSVFCVDHGPCYRCLFPNPPPAGTVANCAEAGVLGVLPGILGVIQATETLKLILNLGTTLAGRLLLLDASSLQFQEKYINRHVHCRCCGQQTDFNALKGDHVMQRPCLKEQEPHQISAIALKPLLDTRQVFLIDVRTTEERAAYHIGGISIPLDDLKGRVKDIETTLPIIVYCHAGVRSAEALPLLAQAGFQDCKQLQGGVLAWREQWGDTRIEAA